MVLTPSRTLLFTGVGVGVLLFASLGLNLVGGAEPNPIVPASAPVTPVIPAPVPPAGHHIIRFQDLIPYATGKSTLGPGNGAGASETDVETGPELTLGECIAIALERQPTLKAAKASIASIEASYKALISFGTAATIFNPDLEIRKQQAQRGLAASAGEYQKAHNEAIQDVTRMYYSAVYAAQQGRLANKAVMDLEQIEKVMKDILNSKLPPKEQDVTVEKLLAVQMGVNKAKELQLEATVGRKRAMAALRQAMAVDDNFLFQPKDGELPFMSQQIPITKQFVVDQALCRRPELALAAAGVDVFRLEVYAQGRIPFGRIVPTFASGADLHAKEIPQALRGKDYRPGGIIPEMPTQLVGNKRDRVARAMSFSEKAEAVYESARNLIVLEAEEAFYQYAIANQKLTLRRDSNEKANDLWERTKAQMENIKQKEQIVQVQVAVAKVKSEYVEANFDYLLSLAALERITAGGIQAEFPGR